MTEKVSLTKEMLERIDRDSDVLAQAAQIVARLRPELIDLAKRRIEAFEHDEGSANFLVTAMHDLLGDLAEHLAEGSRRGYAYLNSQRH